MNNSLPPRITLTPEQVKQRRARNIAIGLAVAFLCIVFYTMTLIRLGPAALSGGM